MDEFKIFYEKLEIEIDSYRQKLIFCRDHKFDKEVAHLQNKIHLLREVNSEIEAIVKGIRKAKDVKFYFND